MVAYFFSNIINFKISELGKTNTFLRSTLRQCHMDETIQLFISSLSRNNSHYVKCALLDTIFNP